MSDPLFGVRNGPRSYRTPTTGKESPCLRYRRLVRQIIAQKMGPDLASAASRSPFRELEIVDRGLLPTTCQMSLPGYKAIYKVTTPPLTGEESPRLQHQGLARKYFPKGGL